MEAYVGGPDGRVESIVAYGTDDNLSYSQPFSTIYLLKIYEKIRHRKFLCIYSHGFSQKSELNKKVRIFILSVIMY